MDRALAAPWQTPWLAISVARLEMSYRRSTSWVPLGGGPKVEPPELSMQEKMQSR